jgi:hypothetical protein
MANRNPNTKGLKPFKKGADSRRNIKGAPKKTYSDHIADIKLKGYQVPTKAEYFDMIGLLLSMTEDDLKEFATGKENPYWIRLLIIDLNNKQIRHRLMADYRDWLFGKAEQKMDVDVKTTPTEKPLSEKLIEKLIDKL